MYEFLRYCAKIPYNSAARDLPSSYDGYQETYGLDCVGFANLAIEQFSNSFVIKGWYQGNGVHVAAIVDQYYIDPYLRMKYPLPMSPNGNTVDTYYSLTNVYAQSNPDNYYLRIEQKKFTFLLNAYDFYLNQQDIENPSPGRYRFIVVHDGNPVIVEKGKTLQNSVSITIKGSSEEHAEHVLRTQYGIGLGDVARMFFDAKQNKAYNDFW